MTTAQERYLFLEKLAKEPVCSETFPSHFGAIIKIQAALNDEEASYHQVVKVLLTEPIICAKVVQASNTANFYGSKPIKDVERAVSRLGVMTVRRIAVTTALQQLQQSKTLLPFSSVSRHLWIHGLQTAAAAKVLALHTHPFKPDDALFSGLTLNIGGFYLLYRISQASLFKDYLDEVVDWIRRHILSTSYKVLKEMSLPEDLVEAMNLSDRFEKPAPADIPTLKDLLHTAHLLASHHAPWIDGEMYDTLLLPQHFELSEEITALFHELNRAYSS